MVGGPYNFSDSPEAKLLFPFGFDWDWDWNMAWDFSILFHILMLFCHNYLYIYFFWRMNEEYETIRVMKVFIMKIKDLDTLK